MRYKIQHPTDQPNGNTSFGPYTVRFRRGTATLDAVPNVLAAMLTQRGYKITMDHGGSQPEAPRLEDVTEAEAE